MNNCPASLLEIGPNLSAALIQIAALIAAAVAGYVAKHVQNSGTNR